MGDLYLNESTGDIAIVGNSPQIISDKSKEVGQRLAIVLNTSQGEWFYDISVGVPYFQNIFGHRYDKDIVDLTIRAAILNTTDVVEIVAYESLFDPSNRKFNINTTVTTEEGDLVVVST